MTTLDIHTRGIRTVTHNRAVEYTSYKPGIPARTLINYALYALLVAAVVWGMLG